MSEDRKPETRLVEAGRRKEWTQGIVNPAVWRASTILFDSVADMQAANPPKDGTLHYGRNGTPTSWALCEALTELEPGAAMTRLYPSGSAAVAGALLSVLQAGDELLMVDSAYGPTRALCEGVLKRFGVTTLYYDPLLGAGIAGLIGERTRAIFMESPGTHSFEVQDVPAICAAAKARGLVTLIDNTWATPLFFRAIAAGVDLSILACTKYIGGHADVMLGSVTATEAYAERLEKTRRVLGQTAGPDDAWLALRGLRTLDVRLRRHQENGVKVAQWLKAQPQVLRVLHPALPDCPGHDHWRRDFSGATGLFSFVLDGDAAARTRLIDGLELFGIGYSWGGYESLAVPADPVRTATKADYGGPLVRLHVGLEHPDDLIADLAAGLARLSNGFAADLGLSLPAVPDTPVLIAAGATIVGVGALAWLAGRYAGPRLSESWEKVAGTRGEGIHARICAMSRYLVLALGIALALAFYPWPELAVWPLGLVGATAAALLVKAIVRGLNLSRWIAWLLAAATFAALLAKAVGGLAPLSEALDAAGFTLGSRRFTLLALVQIVIGLLALYAVVRFAIRLSGQWIKRSRGFDPTQQLLAQKLAALAIIAVAFFVGIDLAGIDLTALAVFSGALGLAVGFGLQKTFGNLIAGIILLMDRSIKPGDVISVGESFGSVNKIGVRAVSIVTRDGKEYLIPNELLMTQEVVNWSYSTRDVRISIPIGIAYDCDVKLAHKLMVEAANASPRVLATPQPAVWMTKFGESAIEHEIRVWISDPEAGLGSVRSEILNRVLELFREHGIAVPYPQHDVRIREWPNPSSAAPPPER